MTRRRFRTALALILLPLAAPAADDLYGDLLPEGAKARLGTARLRFHVGSATTLIPTPDGKFLIGVTTGIDYYDLATGKLTKTVLPSRPLGGFPELSADGKRLLVTSQGRIGTSSFYSSVHVLDVESGKELTSLNLPFHSGQGTWVEAASLSANGKRVAVGFTRWEKEKLPAALVRDVDADKQIASVAPIQNQKVHVALSPDGKRLATWGYHVEPGGKAPPEPAADPNRVVQFWDADTGKETAKARLSAAVVQGTVVFSPGGSLAAASAGNGEVHLLDPATGDSKGLLRGRPKQGRRLAFSPDGKTVAASGRDGSVQRWTLADGKLVGTTEPPFPIPTTGIAPAGRIRFADNERILVSTRRSLAWVVWEAPSGKSLTPAGGHSGRVIGAAFAGQEVLTVDTDGLILRWDPATGKELGIVSLMAPDGTRAKVVPYTVALSPDGTRALALDAGRKELGVYDLPAGERKSVIPGDYTQSRNAAFTADGTKVVQAFSTSDPKRSVARAVVWDVAAGKKLGGVELPGVLTAAAVLTPDGKTLITAGIRPREKAHSELVVTGWELATGKKLGEYVEVSPYGGVFAVAVGDNKSVVVPTRKGSVALIDAVAGTKVRDLDLGGRPGMTPVVSPDGKTVAVAQRSDAGPNMSIVMLMVDFGTGKVTKTLSNVTDSPFAAGGWIVAAFSPDGKTLVTSSTYDTTGLVWDVSGP